MAGKNYRVERATNLTPNAYTAVSAILPGTGGSMSFTDTSNMLRVFYRVTIVS